MEPVISVNGNELGLLSSVTYVLEKIIDMSTLPEDENNSTYWHKVHYSVEHPKIWDKYIVFHRDAYIDGIGASMLRYGWTNQQMNFLGLKTLKIYIYRPILETDACKTSGVNIYNEDGSLFYSSDKFPLRIKDIITDLSWEGTILAHDKPLDHRSGYQGCMVLTYLSVSVEGDFFSLLFGYGINNTGNVSRTTDLAGLGGGGVYGNDIGCIVAYAPDCYPQWLNNNTMQRSVLP